MSFLFVEDKTVSHDKQDMIEHCSMNSYPGDCSIISCLSCVTVSSQALQTKKTKKKLYQVVTPYFLAEISKQWVKWVKPPKSV